MTSHCLVSTNNCGAATSLALFEPSGGGIEEILGYELLVDARLREERARLGRAEVCEIYKKKDSDVRGGRAGK